MDSSFVRRAHIQNLSAASALEHHWGYADRAVPCTNDAGSCEYLDVVYHSHDLGMLYCGIIWATILGILFVWWIGRLVTKPTSTTNSASVAGVTGENPVPQQSGLQRLRRSIAAHSRKYLLPEFSRPIFGRTTRLQVVVLLVLTGYLTIWSFVGIVYKRWITPVKNTPGVYNTRTSLGPWVDRIGVFAYALTPLSVLLATRESLLSIITGVPYQTFNFLHRWLGYIIFVQSALHTIGWCVIELRLYQPQPAIGLSWIKQLYMIWGVIAMFFLFVLFALATPWGIRLTGYEFFRKSHYVLAMLYIGGCWGHWANLSCYMIPSLVVWFIDRGVRLARTALLHYNYLPGGTMGFASAKAAITYFPDSVHGDIVRLDFRHPQDAWEIGQHFYLCFMEGSIWQSHPFTPLSLPAENQNDQLHSYILRAKKGETKKIADIAAVKLATLPSSEKASTASDAPTTPVILNGPYGQSIVDGLTPEVNVLCIAGGTGVTFVLPVLLRLATLPPSSGRKLSLVWAIRKKSDAAWIKQELDILHESSKALDLAIHVYVTREDEATLASSSKPALTANEKEASSSSNSSVSKAPALGSLGRSPSFSIEEMPVAGGHPDLDTLVNEFVRDTIRGRTAVLASGPGSMITDLRTIVAQCNAGSKVWKGDERFDVDLVYDDRVEW